MDKVLLSDEEIRKTQVRYEENCIDFDEYTEAIAKAQLQKVIEDLRERAEIFKKSAKEADNYSLAYNSHEDTIRSVYLENLAETYEKELQG